MLNPLAFDNDSLYFRTHNGGVWPETFFISGKEISHGQAPSFSVSALGGLGITQGWIELGDAGRGLRITVDKGEAALIGLISYKKIKEKYFYRLSFSAAEMDETVIINQKANLVSGNNLRCSLSIRAFYLQ